jgi:sigma-B regulation protein RsbU (phosphoserine phosphatase)
VNGAPVGAIGFLPALEAGGPIPQIVTLPGEATDLQFALRVNAPPHVAEAYAMTTVFEVVAGSPKAVTSVCNEYRFGSLLLTIFSLSVDVLLVLGGIAALALYFNQRSHPEYFWLGLLLAVTGASDFCSVGFGVVPLSASTLFGVPAGYLAIALQIEFTFAFALRRVTRPWRVYELLLIVFALAQIPLGWFGAPAMAMFIWGTAASVPASIVLSILLFVWYHRGNREAGWLIVPTLFGLSGVLFGLGFFAFLFRWQRLLFLFRIPTLGAVGFHPVALANFSFLITIGIVIFLRFARVSRSEARVAAELDAAREIQRALVRIDLPEIEGCRLAAAYFPAAEVGGDFYQVLRQPDGSTLIAVGDVSGKGLKAAMTGTLAIGALRTLAASGLSPSALLAALNLQIIDAQQGGFVTTICSRISTGGDVMIANAGHIHPYLNGDEIVLDSAFPLGISADAAYSETLIHLAPGDTLTFLSDGVVEACNASGELFGFDRTREISRQSAGQIAQVAQSFGQQDDITVLTIVCTSAEALSMQAI